MAKWVDTTKTITVSIVTSTSYDIYEIDKDTKQLSLLDTVERETRPTKAELKKEYEGHNIATIVKRDATVEKYQIDRDTFFANASKVEKEDK